MTKVQPELSRALKKTEATPVLLGRESKTPILALVPWPCYLKWCEASNGQRLHEQSYTATEAHWLTLSYRERIAPLLLPEIKDVTRVIVIGGYGKRLGVIMAWRDWEQFAPHSKMHTTPTYSREYTIVTAHKHLSQLPAQFAEEEVQEVLEAITVTKQGKPVMAIVPWALYKRWQVLIRVATVAIETDYLAEIAEENDSCY